MPSVHIVPSQWDPMWGTWELSPTWEGFPSLRVVELVPFPS